MIRPPPRSTLFPYRRSSDLDPGVRRGAGVTLGNQAAAGAAPVVEAALKRESDRWVHHALAEALALIQLANGVPAQRAAAARTLGELHSESAVPALQRLAADTGATPAERDAAVSAIRRIEPWGLLTRAVETLFQGALLGSILLLMALGLA